MKMVILCRRPWMSSGVAFVDFFCRDVEARMMRSLLSEMVREAKTGNPWDL